MGTNIEQDRLIKSRNEIMDGILENMRTWNGDMESGIELVENNRIDIDKIKKINEKMDSMSMPDIHDEDYRNKLNALYNEQKKLFKVLEGKQRELMEEKEQLNKKDKVVRSYINKKTESVFIDKDVE